MRRRLGPVWVGALLISGAGCSGSTPPAPAAPPLHPVSTTDAAAPEPKSPAPVVVGLVVDQFSAWVAEERLPLLSPDGFFARMTREGTWAKRMRYPYAITDTAPGHTALHSGHVPSESHILVNENPDDKTGLRTSYFRDPKTKLVTPDGLANEWGSSTGPLAVDTVADRLHAANPRAKILSFSLKDRAALLPAGQHPNHAIYFDPSVDSFVTSTAVEPTFPSWAKPIADQAAVKRARAQGWAPLDRAWLVAHAGADDAPGEGDLVGLGTTFPHRVPNARAFRATPLSDPIILDLALAGVKNERDPNEPLLLLVSLSSNDVIGHTFGVDSWEAWDCLKRVDLELARFLGELEKMTGPVSVILSGDHGNSSIPEARHGCSGRKSDAADPYERPCSGGGRLMPDVLREEIRAEVARAIGRADAISGVSDGYVFLSKAGRALDGVARDRLDAAVRKVLLEKHRADIAAVFDARELAQKCPDTLAHARGIPERAKPGEDLLTLVCRSWAPDAGAGDYYVVPASGSYFDGEIVPGKGGSHGTPWLYDRTVPLFVRGAGVDPGVTTTDPIDFTAYSTLEASFLGLEPRKPREILDALRAR